ncbi:beta-ketoacyl-ACP synthase III [Dermabacteraceae bacterium P7074]
MSKDVSARITAASGPAGSRIAAFGAARGDLSVPNSELIEAIDSSDEWIRQRTGIVTRSRASKDLTVTELARRASVQAMERAEITPAEIDAVLVATITFPYQTPAMAPLLAHELGIKDAAAYDLSAACAGFCYGIGQADALVRSGVARNVLVVGADKMSDFIDPTDRSISFLMGDGAGAAIVTGSETAKIGPTRWGSDGSNWRAIRMTGSLLDVRGCSGPAWPTLEQEGRTVFRWAVWHTADIVRQTLAKSGLTLADVDVFVPHQANMRIINELVKQLKLSDDTVVARDIETTGNTSAASVPLAVDRLLCEGTAKSGDVCVLIGFGAGLAYAAQVVVLP